MKLDWMRASAADLFSQRNAALIACGLLAMSNLVLVTAYIFKGERVVVVPPQLTRSFWVEGSNVSREYLEEMGLFMSTLLLDISPSSAAFKHQTLLKYVTPESYGALKKQLLKDEERYQELQLSTTFKPVEVLADSQSLQVNLKGYLSSYMGADKIQSEEMKLTLKFTSCGAGLLLEEVKGDHVHAQ